MSCHSITVDPSALGDNAEVAVLRCSGEPLCLSDLLDAVAKLPAQATRVVLAPADASVADLIRFAAPTGGVMATARPVTDALKRVEDGRIVGSVDRDQLFRAGLPLGLSRRDLALRLALLTGRYVHAGELVGDRDVRFLTARDGPA